MKHLRPTSALAVLLLFLPAVALAAEQHKSVTLDQSTMIGNQQLKPGDYTLKWDDSTDTTRVNVEHNGKSVATVPARIVRKSNPDNATFETNTANGQNTIDRVYTAKERLEFGDTSANSSSPTGTPPTK